MVSYCGYCQMMFQTNGSSEKLSSTVINKRTVSLRLVYQQSIRVKHTDSPLYFYLYLFPPVREYVVTLKLLFSPQPSSIPTALFWTINHPMIVSALDDWVRFAAVLQMNYHNLLQKHQRDGIRIQQVPVNY